MSKQITNRLENGGPHRYLSGKKCGNSSKIDCCCVFDLDLVAIGFAIRARGSSLLDIEVDCVLSVRQRHHVPSQM